jgi:hypothetical protein
MFVGQSQQMRSVISAITRSLSFFCVMSFTSLNSVRTVDLGLSCMAEPRFNSLVLILNFRDAEPPNLVLQSRPLQSEPFGGAPLACNSSGRSS